MLKPTIAIPSFAPRLIAWQRAYGRHDLPWQRTCDPYRIWISEIMLQQTQVLSVIPYYERFIARFPDLSALAQASLDEVMALWSGLGYYSRARHLHRCAQQLVAKHQGRFPKEADALAALPGIGRSTAAAIAAFAFGARRAILDGNVKRVLARLFGIEAFPGERHIESAMWALAESLLPPAGNRARAEIRAYTQGLMDFGATLCTRSRPACRDCPFRHDCAAYASGRERELPLARPRKEMPVRNTLMLILRNGNAVLLERRAPAGVWGGLWSLPQAADEAALAAAAARFGAAGAFTPLNSISHTFTHFRLIIEPRLVSLSASNTACMFAADTDHIWAPVDNLSAYGLPAPVRRLLAASFNIIAKPR